MIRPTARLNFGISAKDYSDELIVDLKRCFLNVAPLQIEKRAESDDPAETDGILGLVVVLNYPYWMEEDERVDSDWNDVLVPWLKKKLYKLNATVQGYRKTGHVDVTFGRLEIHLGGHVVSVLLPMGMEFPDEALEAVKLLREYVKAGTLPDGEFGTVDVPWKDPEYFALLSEAKDALAAREECGGSPGSAEEEPFEDGEENPDVPGVNQAKEDSDSEEGAVVNEPAESLEEPSIDYTLWGIHANDGVVRKFDSADGKWID